MSSDRPTAPELIEAIREWLERDVMAATEGRVQFHARVAINALGITQRELESDEDGLPREELEALARQIRCGDVPDGALERLREHVAAKLRVASPRYLERY